MIEASSGSSSTFVSDVLICTIQGFIEISKIDVVLRIIQIRITRKHNQPFNLLIFNLLKQERYRQETTDIAAAAVAAAAVGQMFWQILCFHKTIVSRLNGGRNVCKVLIFGEAWKRLVFIMKSFLGRRSKALRVRLDVYIFGETSFVYTFVGE